MEKKTLSQIIRRLSVMIEEEPDNANLYFERGMAYFDYENWFNAEDDFSQAIALDPKNWEYLLQRGISYFNQKNWEEAIADFQELTSQAAGRGKSKSYHSWLSKACEQKQATQSLEERMAPYAEMIKKQEYRGNYTELVAAMGFFEEYDLLESFLQANTDSGKAPELLNAHVRPQFSYWQPTPLYLITSYNVQKAIKDPCRMLRLLKKYGADPNREAGDGSTPLWNQASPDGSFEVFQTLLELGADPNKISIDGEHEWTPLTNCLRPNPDENDEDSWLPFDALAIKKATLLLEYGADPNLTSSSFPDHPPLVMAINYGFPSVEENKPLSAEALELIEMLLLRGADPNFTTDDGDTPLLISIENNLFEVGQLLLLYGAEMPEEEDISYGQHPEGLKATEDCYFRPGGGDAWEKSFFSTKDEIFNPATTSLKTDNYHITISERTPDSLRGRITFVSPGLTIDVGGFSIGAKHPIHSTEYKNVAYDTHMRLTLEWTIETNNTPEDNDKLLSAEIARRWEEMREKYDKKPDLIAYDLIIKQLNTLAENGSAMIVRPASAEDLVLCDTDLSDLDYPELPDEYADFLKICGGFAFNSAELYGTDIVTNTETNFQLIDIVTATDDFNDYYVDGGYLDLDYPLLCFGQWNGDYFTYDPQTGKYQVRSHECIGNIWDEYDSFIEFFMKEVVHN